MKLTSTLASDKAGISVRWRSISFFFLHIFDSYAKRAHHIYGITYDFFYWRIPKEKKKKIMRSREMKWRINVHRCVLRIRGAWRKTNFWGALAFSQKGVWMREPREKMSHSKIFDLRALLQFEARGAWSDVNGTFCFYLPMSYSTFLTPHWTPFVARTHTRIS